MPRTKSKTSAKSNTLQIWTIALYVLLTAGIVSYFLPFISVQVPVVGKKSWSVQDVVKTIPKSVSTKEKKRGTFSKQFDFMDFLKEISPKGEGVQVTQKRVTNAILGALVPIALIVAYFTLIAGLFAVRFNKPGLLAFVSGVASGCAGYVVVAILYFNLEAQQAFNAAMSKAQDSPFFMVTKNFVSEVSIQPEYGAYVLLGFAILALIGVQLQAKLSHA
jgi:hypothetical protein